MLFRIADTFTDSLARLNNQDQKVAKTTAFDLQVNIANPGMSFHRIDLIQDKNFWSVRVNRDLRIIVHRTVDSLLLCYVSHHEDAYKWAERRKLVTHPQTGAAQIVVLPEMIEPAPKPVAEQIRQPAPPVSSAQLFKNITSEMLLSFGVPVEWLNKVLAATEETLLELIEHLPAEAAEAVLELATGGNPVKTVTATGSGNPFDHPDALRRFRIMNTTEELQQALDYPWDKWTIFLHPEQRSWVEANQSGPAKVSGSAGTGKTIVALHRAVFLARQNPDHRVLLTTFSESLANALKTRLSRLVSCEPKLAERIEVSSLEATGEHLYRINCGNFSIADRPKIEALLLQAAAKAENHKFTMRFLLSEWDDIIDAWQLKTLQEYLGVARLGRRTRLPEAQRKVLWSIFEQVIAELKKQGLITRSELFTNLAETIKNRINKPFDHIVVDEAQDMGIAHMRFFAAMGGEKPNGLFFAGDIGQRIFQQPFSWLALGVDIRGRARMLKVNYRTSHQIRSQADCLLDPELVDMDGNSEVRNSTVSVFNGPPPLIKMCKDEQNEIEMVAEWLAKHVKSGIAPHECGIFVRSEAQLERAVAAVKKAGIAHKILDAKMQELSGFLSIGTMHIAKGLEFRAVAVMACDDEVVPLQNRIESIGDEGDLAEFYNTERHLLYVACTRARDHLMVTGVEPVSEFIQDLLSA